MPFYIYRHTSNLIIQTSSWPIVQHFHHREWLVTEHAQEIEALYPLPNSLLQRLSSSVGKRLWYASTSLLESLTAALERFALAGDEAEDKGKAAPLMQDPNTNTAENGSNSAAGGHNGELELRSHNDIYWMIAVEKRGLGDLYATLGEDAGLWFTVAGEGEEFVLVPGLLGDDEGLEGGAWMDLSGEEPVL